MRRRDQELSLSGTVRDTSGAVEASDWLTSAGTQVATTTTDEAGRYRFTGLSGSFELSVTMRGFEPRSGMSPSAPTPRRGRPPGRRTCQHLCDRYSHRRQGDGHSASCSRRRRAGPGQHHPAGTDSAAGPQQRWRRAAKRLGRPGDPLVGVYERTSAASSTPIATASTPC